MNKAKLLPAAGIALALALAFSCSSDGGTAKTCGGKEYDSGVYRCESGELVGKCKGEDFYPDYQSCVDGVIVDNSGEPFVPPTGPFTITTSAYPAGGGTVVRNPNAATYEAGTQVTLTAAPAAGYSFVGWMGSVEAETQSATVTANGNLTMTANFIKQPTGYCCWVANADNNWTDVCAPIGPEYNVLSAAACQADNGIAQSTDSPPSIQYCDWGAGGCWPIMNPSGTHYDENGMPTVFTNLQACQEWGIVRHSATACPNYGGGGVANYTLTASASPTAGGSVTRSPDAPSYAAGTQVTVTATPKSGYTFRGWLGAAETSDPTVTVTMDGNLSLTGIFDQQISGGGGDSKVRFSYSIGGIPDCSRQAYGYYEAYIGTHFFKGGLSACSGSPGRSPYSTIPPGTYEVTVTSATNASFTSGVSTKVSRYEFVAGQSYTVNISSGAVTQPAF